MNVTQAFLWFI